MRRPPRAGMVTLCGRDLADFGFTLARAPNLLGTMSFSHPTGTLVGLAGQVATGRDAVIDPTVVPLEVSFAGDSRAELMAALDTIAHWCALGPLELSSSFDWTKVCLVAYNGPGLFVPGKQFKETTLQGTLSFTRRNPYTFDRFPRRVSTNGSGPGNRVDVETGSAPSHAILWLVDATSATITHRAANGTIVRQSTLTTVQGPNDALVVDGARKRLSAYISGVAADVPRDLTLGHGFVTLEPQYAHLEARRWQTLETSSGRLSVDFVRSWLR